VTDGPESPPPLRPPDDWAPPSVPSAAEPQAPAQPVPTPPLTGQRVVERAHPLTPFVRGWLFFVAMIGWIGKDYLPNSSRSGSSFEQWNPLYIGLVVLVIALLIGLSGLVTWLTTKFVADETELSVETGWLFRRSNRIAYSRIQSVDMVQPLAARIFGLAEVKIDVGGEGATKLQYLTRARATELRDYLMRRAHGQQVSVAESNASAATNVLDDLGATDKVLIRVPAKDLIIGALLSHELLFIVLGFLLPAATVFGVGLLIATFTGRDIPTANFAIGFGLLFPMAMAIFSFLSKRVLGQFNYTLAETRAGLRITRGLTSLTSQTVPANRIQSIRIAQPILWRLIGRSRLDIEVLGYGSLTGDEDSSGTSTILLPIGTQQMVDTALHAVWPGLRLDQIQFRRNPERSKVLDPLTYGWLAYGLDDQVVVARTGWLTRIQSIVPHARLQSVRVTQGPWERKLELANLEFHTTGLLKRHAIHHLDAADARRLLFDEADRAKTARTAELEGAPQPDVTLGHVDRQGEADEHPGRAGGAIDSGHLA